MPAVRRSFFTANQPSFSFARMQWARSMDRPDADLLRAFARNKLQQKLAEELCFVACERVDHKAAPVVVMAAAFCESKYWGFIGNVLFSFRLLSAPRACTAARGIFVFAVNFVGGCARAACGASGGKGAFAVFSGAAARLPGSPVSGGGGALRCPPACIRRIRPCNTGMHPRYTVPLR